MKWLRRGAAALAILVAVPLLLAAIVLAAIQLPAVQSWMADKVAELTAGSDTQIRITGLSGPLPFSPAIERLTVADKQGVWLEADDARLDIAWTQLFSGLIHIREVGAARVAVQRTPVSTAPEPPPEPFSLPDPTSLPRSVPHVLVDRIYVDRVELAEPVVGKAAVLALDGAVLSEQQGSVVNAKLDLRRTDEASLSLTLSGIVDLAARQMDLDLNGSETGGLVAKLAGLPQAGDLQLALKGAGPLDDWRGRLDLDLANVAAMDADLMLGITDQANLGVDGQMRPSASLLPPDIRPLVGEKADLSLHGRIEGDGSIGLERLRLVVAAATLSGEASIPADERGPAGRFVTDVPDLAAFSGLAGTSLHGQAQANLSLGGTRDRPTAKIELTGAGLEAQQASLQQLSAQLDLVAGSALGETLQSGNFQLSVTASGLEVPDVVLPGDGTVTAKAAGSAAREGRVQLTSLAAAGLGASLEGHGEIDTASLQGSGLLQADVPSLAMAAPFLPGEWRSLDGRGALDAEFATTGSGQGDGTSHLTLELTNLAGVPAQFQDVLGQRVSVAAQALIDNLRHITVRDFSAETAAVTLSGQAAASLDGGPVSAELQGMADNLGRFAALAGQPLSGRAGLQLRVGGTSAAPIGTVRLETNDLAGLPDDLAALLGSSPSLDAQAARADDGTLRLSGLNLQTASATMTGSGRYQPRDGVVEAALDGHAADLAFLGRWLGGSPRGSATLNVRATGTVAAPSATASLRADDLSGLPPQFSDLAGPQVDLALQGAMTPGEAGRVARLDRLDLKTAAITMNGSGTYGLDDGAVQAAVQAELADLTKASAAAATPLAGSLRLKADVNGTVAQPRLQARLDGDGVQAAGRSLGKVTANLDAQDLIAAPAGTLDLAVVPGRDPLTLKASFRKGETSIEVPTIEFRGPGRLALDGGMTVQTAPVLATGKLSGGVRDLAALEPFVGMPLQGRLNLDIQADGASGQSARVSVKGDGVGLPGVVTLESVSIEAALRDLLATPSLRATLAADGIRRPQVDLSRTRLSAEGRLDSLTIAASTTGTAMVPLTLDAGATIRQSDGRTVVDLTKLAGTIAEKPLRLQKTARVEVASARTALSNLDLRYDRASLTGDVALAGERAEGNIRLRSLDLASLVSFGAPPLAGQVEADMTLAGSLRAPRIQLNGRGRDITVGEGLSATGGAPLAFDLAASTAGGAASGNLSLSGLGNAPLRLDAKVPLTLSLQPFDIALPPDGSLAGSLTGTADLAQAARFAALDGQRLQGSLESNLRLSGTLTQPAANGSLQIRDAAVADTASGVALRNLNLVLQATGRQIRLEQLSATDGGSGRLSGTGGIDLGRPRLPFQASIRMDDFRPVYRDDLLVRLGGNVDVSGDDTAANIVGRFLVDRAEISIPDGGGSGTIPVVEPTAGPGVDPEPAAGPAVPAYQANLDIVVDMPERIFVRGRGLESEWGGAVQVKGTATEPIVTGNIEVKRGYLNLLDRRFDLERGIVSLDGAVPPDPDLDIRATFEANTLVGILQVSGRASDPKLELTSDPIRPPDEIMAEILFGRDVTKITAAQGLQLAAALNTLRGGGSGGLLDTLRRNLGVDTLDFGGDGADDASVKAGKYISDDVYLQVERGVAPGSGKATVEVEVVPNVTVQTEVGEDSQTGFGVQWKYDY